MSAFRVPGALTILMVLAAVGPGALAAQGIAPANVVATDMKGSVLISWSAVSDPAVVYRVVRADDAKTTGLDLTQPLRARVSSYVDATAKPGATYFYQVIAVYGKGEAASLPVQFPAAVGKGAPYAARTGVPIVPMATLAPKAPVPTISGLYNQVTLSWSPMALTVPEPVTYVVRRFLVDPATVPPTVQPGYVTGNPGGPAGGPITIIDRNADLHAPTWYKIVATTTTQGIFESSWYRRDPPLHRGVDTISGNYWREVIPQGTKTFTHWAGCFKGNPVTGAGMYGARVRVGSGSWVTIPMAVPGQSSNAALSRPPYFDTSYSPFTVLFQSLENGGQPTVQLWPMYSTSSSTYGPFIPDTTHLQPVAYNFTQVQAPLNLVTCGPLPPPPAPPAAPAPPPPAAPPLQKGGALTSVQPAPLPVGTQTVLTAAATPGAGPAPLGVTVTGTPAQARVAWQPTPGVSGYSVTRFKPSDPTCCRVQSPSLPAGATGWDDLVQWTGPWTYQVTAYYPAGAGFPAGRLGTVDVNYIYPEPQTPTGFTAQQTGDGTVVFSWQPVKDASFYVFAGPPTNVAARVNGTTTTVTGLPPGNGTWQVSTSYEPTNGSQSRQGSAFVTRTVNVLPWTGKYRVVADMIRADHTTADTPKVEDVITFNSRNDGAGDEVYLSSVAETLNRSNGSRLQDFPPQVSPVYGDVSAWPQDNRIKAGTASGWGGIRQFDVFAPMLANGTSFVLWEGDLTNGKEDLILHPQLWDVDEPESYLSRYLFTWCPRDVMCGRSVLSEWAGTISHFAHSTSGAAAKAAIMGSQLAVVEGDILWVGSDPNFRNLENQNKDRPIGLTGDATPPTGYGETGQLRDVLVVLSREKIEAAIASGNATINVRMWDHWALPNVPPTANTNQQGDYLLVLRVQRVP